MLEDAIKFRHLQCFLAVAQQGSLQKAADTLSITQPAVSKTLRELEEMLSARLFERGRKGAVLTREGDAFMRHAGASVSALREAVASVAQTRAQGHAVVSIGVLPTVAPWLMPQLLKRLEDIGASSSLRIHTGANPALLAQLRQREIDLVIGRFAEPSQMLGLTFEHLYADPLVLAVRPQHPLLTHKTRPANLLAQLGGFTLILPTPGTAIRHTADSFFSTRGLSLPPRTIETLSVSVARHHAMQSDAVWLSPWGAARPDLDSGALVALPIDTQGTDELVGLTLRADMVANQAQAEVMTAIRSVVAARPAQPAVKARSRTAKRSVSSSRPSSARTS